jgi:predicted TIM-barrel fold metal-dependent hydrolase
MIIDFHCHAGRGDLLTAPWNTIAPMGAYLRRARRAGIDRTVVFPAFHTDYTTANRELARIVARWRPRLIGFAMVNADRDAGRIRAMVREAVTRLGFRGVKVHGHEAMPTREVCDAAREFGVPLIVDVAGRAHVIDMFAPEYPDVRFVIAHLGSFADDWRAHERVVEQMVRYPNVFADTSGVRRFDYLVQAVTRAGAKKLVFGSDGPWLHPGLELAKIRLLGMPGSSESLVLGGNARRLLSRVNTKSYRTGETFAAFPGCAPGTDSPTDPGSRASAPSYIPRRGRSRAAG